MLFAPFGDGVGGVFSLRRFSSLTRGWAWQGLFEGGAAGWVFALSPQVLFAHPQLGMAGPL